jgi:protein ImuA
MDLEELISHPGIWRAGDNTQPFETIPTGFAALDRSLPGEGWPSRAITEIFVDRYGIGELRLLMPALASLEQRSIAWISPPYVPYAPALTRFGLDLDRMFLVQPVNETDVPWAIEEVVRSQFRITVLAWLRSANEKILRRLQLIVEARQAWAVLFRPAAMMKLKSPATLKLRLTTHAEHLKVEILKCRGARPRVVYVPGRGGAG